MDLSHASGWAHLDGNGRKMLVCSQVGATMHSPHRGGRFWMPLRNKVLQLLQDERWNLL